LSHVKHDIKLQDWSIVSQHVHGRGFQSTTKANIDNKKDHTSKTKRTEHK